MYCIPLTEALSGRQLFVFMRHVIALSQRGDETQVLTPVITYVVKQSQAEILDLMIQAMSRPWNESI